MIARSLAAASLGFGLLAAAGCAPSPKAVAAAEAALHADTAIAAAVGAPTRTEANRARDRGATRARPSASSGSSPDDTVVEIWPGGGWYTEILAPLAARARHLLCGRQRSGGSAARGRWRRRTRRPTAAIRYAAFPAGSPGDRAAGAGRHRRRRPHLPQRPQLDHARRSRSARRRSGRCSRC